MNRHLLWFLPWCLLGCGLDRTEIVPESGNGTSTDNVLTRKMRVDSILRDLPRGDSGPYPLLVRMDSSTLSFPSSWQDGRDVRVFLDDSIPVAHAVRDWSVASQRGSVWVRLPSYYTLHRTVTVRIGRDSSISRSSKTAVWAGVSEWTRSLTSTIRLAEFDTDSITPMTPCGCNQWYIGRSKNGSIGVSSGIELAGKGRPGRAFHLSYNTPLGEWNLVGTRLGLGTNHLAALDSIVFWARGNGVIKVALEDHRDTTDYSKAWTAVALDTAWRRYSVPPSDFDLQDPYSMGWEGVKDRVSTISFFGHTGTDFWIDGIALMGIAPSEIR
ncbi:MAG: hypothetical protein IPN71_03170 [Fibrobacteres bacterium]|nr:hypothetical protein [Fibrobacterota bacterium]